MVHKARKRRLPTIRVHTVCRLCKATGWREDVVDVYGFDLLGDLSELTVRAKIEGVCAECLAERACLAGLPASQQAGGQPTGLEGRMSRREAAHKLMQAIGRR